MKNVLLAIRAFGQSNFGSMKAFAEALGISPQNLNSYLKGERRPGGVFIDRLNGLGFDTAELLKLKHEEIPQNTTEPTSDAGGLGLVPDISRACRLLNCTPEELAQSIGASRKIVPAWEAGEARPSYDQLVMLYHQVLAIAVHCCEAERRPAAEARQAVAG